MEKAMSQQVKAFHQAFGLPVGNYEAALDPSTEEQVAAAHAARFMKSQAETLLRQANDQKSLLLMRLHLLVEEVSEVADALSKGDGPGLLKEMADVQYVLDGAHVSFGTDMIADDAFDEVHQSNMSKMGPDGTFESTEGGRILKGPHYAPANMDAVFARWCRDWEEKAA